MIAWLHVACGLASLAWAGAGVWLLVTKLTADPTPVRAVWMAGYGGLCAAVCVYCAVSLRDRRRLEDVKWAALGLVLFVPVGTVVGAVTFFGVRRRDWETADELGRDARQD